MSSQSETYLDERFSNFMADRSGLEGSEKSDFYDIVLRLSMSHSEGHSCLQLTPKEKSNLLGNRLVAQAEVANGNEPLPLVLFEDKLYLERYYTYEARLAKQIKNLAKTCYKVELDEAVTVDLFPGETVATSDQMRAAVTALNRALMIVGGGPGTGKTTTVVKMLALI